METLIKDDLRRYIPKPYSARNLLQGFRSQGFRYLFFKRKVDASKKGSLRWYIYKIILRHYTYKYGFQIGGKIGGGCYISHFGSVVVSENAVIGKNCNIAHGVTIGVTRRGKGMGTPVIGDEVWMGAYSVIVGGVTVGNNVLIAPGAYVNFDVPDNSLVLGNPGVIKPSLAATDGYINNIVNVDFGD